MPGIGKSVPVDVLSSDRSLRAHRIAEAIIGAADEIEALQ
jgi:hypothetical protein